MTSSIIINPPRHGYSPVGGHLENDIFLTCKIGSDEYGFTQKEISNLITEYIKEKELRSRNPALDMAWEKYQQIRKLLG